MMKDVNGVFVLSLHVALLTAAKQKIHGQSSLYQRATVKCFPTRTVCQFASMRYTQLHNYIPADRSVVLPWEQVSNYMFASPLPPVTTLAFPR